MADGQSWGVPPNLPPPVPSPNFVTAPPAGMPPPVPGTGASGQYSHPVAAHVPMRVAQHQTPHPAVGGRPGQSRGVAYLLWFFLGFLGIHHFYLGKVGRGVGYFLTFGWFMIGLLIDLFTLPSQVHRVNGERKAGLR